MSSTIVVLKSNNQGSTWEQTKINGSLFLTQELLSLGANETVKQSNAVWYKLSENQELTLETFIFTLTKETTEQVWDRSKQVATMKIKATSKEEAVKKAEEITQNVYLSEVDCLEDLTYMYPEFTSYSEVDLGRDVEDTFSDGAELNFTWKRIMEKLPQLKAEDLRIDKYQATVTNGPWSLRVTHTPTGITVEGDHTQGSQHQVERDLVAKLEALVHAKTLSGLIDVLRWSRYQPGGEWKWFLDNRIYIEKIHPLRLHVSTESIIIEFKKHPGVRGYEFLDYHNETLQSIFQALKFDSSWGCVDNWEIYDESVHERKAGS